MCCLRYEFDAYKDFKGRAPKLNATVQTPAGPAKVVDLDVPREIVSLKVEGEKPVKVPLSDFDPAPEECYAAQCRVARRLGRTRRAIAGSSVGEALSLLDQRSSPGPDKLAEGAKVRRTGGSRKGSGEGGALAPQRLRGPRARQLALGGGSGGVSGPGRPAPQAPPLHEAVGGRRRARFGARVHLPRGGRAWRGSRIAEAAPSALPGRPRGPRTGRDRKDGGRSQSGQGGQGKAQRAKGSQGRSRSGQGDGKSKGASPRPGQKSSGLRAEQGSASRGEGAKADGGASKPRRRRRSRKPQGRRRRGRGRGLGPAAWRQRRQAAPETREAPHS